MSSISAEVLTNLVSLSVLDVRDNRLNVLPDEIGLCQTLERLDLANNSLSALVFKSFKILLYILILFCIFISYVNFISYAELDFKIS